jgi:hypothetical protein
VEKSQILTGTAHNIGKGRVINDILITIDADLFIKGFILGCNLLGLLFSASQTQNPFIKMLDILAD